MDRTKYGRRLTFLNAYFSLAIVLITLFLVILLFCLIGKVSSLLLLWGMYYLLDSAWNCWRQIIELRAGAPVEDIRVSHETDGTLAFWGALVRGVSIVLLMLGALVLSLAALAETITRGNVLFLEGLLSVLGIWAFLWLDRAVWERRVNQGKVDPLEYVERLKKDETPLPDTEAGMQRYIRELGWLIRYGPWIGALLVYIPGFFAYRSGWINMSFSFLAGTVMLVVLSNHWWRACRDRKICQGELEDRLTLMAPIVSTVVTEQKPLYQRLRP